ncbi:uncharacterized protein Z518_00628 [Rhinocladiella mackenziei CBS 650.93]|uniref:Rhinocladiella mackenziei CBS 650.93 unplaced genomic scaffold supercont1.1, whole genome shotgun sequence n=1 Tax=Rhinocladiella mackenziei CBS 650.93 TaxID=1442369 RepID=A0A0D2HFX9_9EURO|nr:uncharacterized protein Z518_00628 [Rhinocladiella mackenziei CBS 650.93]KIX09548.1 hypothetical protein Z518_00628 [Rhinocladiella mackenziei CBS 650.93]
MEAKTQRTKECLYEHKLPVLGVTWGTTVAVSMELMARERFTTGARKLVRARVFAQASTLAALIVLALMEAKDMKEGKGKRQRVLGGGPERS